MGGGPTYLWPAWIIVFLCGASNQMVKFFTYSLAQRRPALAVLGQDFGAPSLTASTLVCLLVLSVLRQGWDSSQTGLALVLAVIVVHDSIKLRTEASRQREVVFHLVAELQDAGPFHLRVADYLDPRTHHPFHVVTGIVYGALFALAFGFPTG